MQTELRDRLTILSTSTYITTAMIKRWLNMAKDWALGFKRWPMIEATGSDLIDSTEEYPYPTLMRTKSAYLITVAGERYRKIRYEDYLAYLEDNSGGNDKVFAEQDRTIHINGNACSVGEAVVIYGFTMVVDMTSDSDATPFNDSDKEGDEAIIERAIYLALKKTPGMQTEAKEARLEAKDILEGVWKRIEESMPREQLKKTPRFRKIDIIKGTIGNTKGSDIGRF